jgi:hypothetical protein
LENTHPEQSLGKNVSKQMDHLVEKETSEVAEAFVVLELTVY